MRTIKSIGKGFYPLYKLIFGTGDENSNLRIELIKNIINGKKNIRHRMYR